MALVAIVGACSEDDPVIGSPNVSAESATTTVSSGPSPSAGDPTSPPGPRCPNARSAPSGAGGFLEGDVDGDGTRDRVSLVSDASGRPDCLAFLVVERDAAVDVLPLVDFDPQFGLPQPRLHGLARIGPEQGAEIAVDVAAGASTQFVALFTMAGGSLQQVTRDNPFEGEHIFAYGGSVGHLQGVDCLERGVVVDSIALPREDFYDVVRQVMRWQEAHLHLEETTQHKAASINEMIRRWPELGSPPFASCT